jgi:hypothetical protein
MSDYRVQLKDKNGNRQFPVTTTQCVMNSEGVSLEQLLSDIQGGTGESNKGDSTVEPIGGINNVLRISLNPESEDDIALNAATIATIRAGGDYVLKVGDGDFEGMIVQYGIYEDDFFEFDVLIDGFLAEVMSSVYVVFMFAEDGTLMDQVALPKSGLILDKDTLLNQKMLDNLFTLCYMTQSAYSFIYYEPDYCIRNGLETVLGYYPATVFFPYGSSALIKINCEHQIVLKIVDMDSVLESIDMIISGGIVHLDPTDLLKTKNRQLITDMPLYDNTTFVCQDANHNQYRPISVTTGSSGINILIYKDGSYCNYLLTSDGNCVIQS